jgi:hypothetical protein
MKWNSTITRAHGYTKVGIYKNMRRDWERKRLLSYLESDEL